MNILSSGVVAVAVSLLHTLIHLIQSGGHAKLSEEDLDQDHLSVLASASVDPKVFVQINNLIAETGETPEHAEV
jgi:hypothetical protein